LILLLYDTAINLQSDIFTEALCLCYKDTHTLHLYPGKWTEEFQRPDISGLVRHNHRNSSECSISTKIYIFLSFLHLRACSLAISNARAPCVSMLVTPYESVCHHWGYKDKQHCPHTDLLSERTHYFVYSTVKKDVWNTTPPRVNKIGWKWHTSGNASMFFFLPVAMHWLHQKNFKLLIVSPLRPLFPSLGFQRRLHSIKGVLLLKVHGVCLLVSCRWSPPKTWTGCRERN